MQTRVVDNLDADGGGGGADGRSPGRGSPAGRPPPGRRCLAGRPIDAGAADDDEGGVLLRPASAGAEVRTAIVKCQNNFTFVAVRRRRCCCWFQGV
jgi:hypothetical protein